jgi:micrococcal nuclease
MSSPTHPSRLRRALPALVVILGVVLGGAAVVHAVWPEDDHHGTVVRVIDGDTLIAKVAGEDLTIRLLNVDTPETKHPDLPVQCLGPEASAFLEQRLPAGTDIELEYDEERTDRYGRTLAGVFESDSLISVEIAQKGLGVPVLFEPNSRFYDRVVDASQKAQLRKVGLFDASKECTLPAVIDSLQAEVQDLPESVEGDPASTIDAVSEVGAHAHELAHLLDGANVPDSEYAVLAVPALSAYLGDRRKEVADLSEDLSSRRDALQEDKDDFDRAEKERKEEERRDKERRQREERERAEQRAQEGSGRHRPAQEPAPRKESSSAPTQTSSPTSTASPSPSKKKSSSSSGGGTSSGKSSCVPYGPEYPYAGGPPYSGKRYGMPGGKTYRRCS